MATIKNVPALQPVLVDRIAGVTDRGLWEHQKQAVARAKTLTAFGIFFGMGAGKTRTAIEIVKGENLKRVLVVMPKALLEDGSWERQLGQYLGETPVIVRLERGTVADKAVQLENLKKQLSAYRVKHLQNLPQRVFVLVNYESAWRSELGASILGFQWDCVILDEAHRIKAAGTDVSRYFFKLTNHATGAKRLALTGTPMPNSPLDLYGLYRFLDCRIFGTRWDAFQNRYAIVGGLSGHQIFDYRNLDELAKKMATISVHVKTDEVIELPDTIHITRYGELEGAARRTYDTLEQDFILEVGNSQNVPDNALVKMLRMQQLTSGFVPELDEFGAAIPDKTQIVSVAKETLLSAVIDQWDSAAPGVIFARFTQDLVRIHAVLAKAGCTSSELSGQRRELSAWKAGKSQYLVVQMQSGSEGIDLTRANNVVYYSKVHSYGMYEQSVARVHRPGQVHKTMFVHLQIRNTIDAVLDEALAMKGNTLRGVLNVYRRIKSGMGEGS